MPANRYRQLILQAGPVAFWELEEGSGATVAHDSAGLQAAASLSNVGFGRPALPNLGVAANFNNSALIAASNAGGFTLSTPFTAEAWFNADASSSGDRNIVGNGFTAPGWQIRLKTGDNIRAGLVTDGADFIFLDTTATASLSYWHHVLLTYDGSGAAAGALKIWLDGKLQATSTVSGGTVSTITTTNQQYIGASSGVNSFVGRITKVALYHRVLPPVEIVSHYEAGITSLGGPFGSSTLRERILISQPAVGGGTAKSDSDSFTAVDAGSIIANITATDTITFAEGTPSIGLATSDTITARDSGALTDATPPPAPQADTFTATETASLAVTVSDSDTFVLAETGAVATPSLVSISDSDTFHFTESGTNKTGGIGRAIYGVTVAFAAGPRDSNPVWTRIDDPASSRLVNGWSLDRGRNYELDKTQTGTARITARVTGGALDPTNAGGPYYGNLDPLKQAAIAIQNPVDSTWHTLFRGFVDQYDETVDISETFIDTTIDLVDYLAILEAVEVIPGHAGTAVPAGSAGNAYYAIQQVDDRIRAALADANVPAEITEIFSGNVQVQGTVYAPRQSILTVIQDAADAEFPGVANFYVSKEGILTFHGRLARFNPTNSQYGIKTWHAGDRTAFTGHTTVAPIFGLNFHRDTTSIINAALATPTGIADADIAGQLVADAGSIATYGTRSVSFENLITSAGDTGAGPTTDKLTETRKFATYYVSNYKNPRNRISQIVFRPYPLSHPNAAALWDLICRIEISDILHVTTTHPGGGGFDEDFYVEGLHYQATPELGAAYPDITLTVDVSPKAYYTTDPF